jgi:hypothetical protein
MRTATKLVVIGGGMLAALAMTAGPAQAGPKGDPDVKAACDTFNHIGAETGLWTRFSCANWHANHNSSVLVVNRTGHRAGFWNGDRWPFVDIDIDEQLPHVTSLPPVVNINGLSGSFTFPVTRPAHRPAHVRKPRTTAVPPKH